MTSKRLREWETSLRANVTDTTGLSLEDFAAECGVDLSGGLTEDAMERLSVAQRLTYWGGEVEAIRRQERQAMGFVKDHIRECDEYGMPRAWIARAGRVTRQTVYTTLEETSRG